MMLRVLLCVAVSCGLGWSAQGKGKGKGHQKGEETTRSVEVSFGARDSRMILDYYHPSSGLPPGLAKRGGDLPPGLERQLRRNGKLPPGLQKKLTPFPRDLEVRLSPIPAGYRRTQLGTWVLLIQDATNVIYDVIDLTRR
jgi:hypothetical protein